MEQFSIEKVGISNAYSGVGLALIQLLKDIAQYIKKEVSDD
jgi:NADPH:quinone reductase-like Zn-dependent oxidoreductase